MIQWSRPYLPQGSCLRRRVNDCYYRYIKEQNELARPINDGDDRMDRLFIWFGRLPFLITAQVIDFACETLNLIS